MVAKRNNSQGRWVLVTALALLAAMCVPTGSEIVRHLSPEQGVPETVAPFPLEPAKGDVRDTTMLTQLIGTGATGNPAGPQSNTVVLTITVGPSPGTPAYDIANGDLYVPLEGVGSRNVSVVSGATNTVIATIPVGLAPRTPAFDIANGDLYVPSSFSQNVSVISGVTNTVITTIPVGSFPVTPAYDPANGELYVPNDGASNVSVISGATNTVIATIPVGSGPQTPTFDSSNGDLYVPVRGNVSVISGATNTVIATIPVGSGPQTPTFDSSNGNLYVANLFSNNVSVISGVTNKVVATIAVGPNPDTPAYDTANGELYVPNDGASNVSVISGATNTVVATIAVGSSPFPPAYDNATGDLYVPAFSQNEVSVISGATNTVIATIAVGAAPGTPVYDSSNGDVYVPNMQSNTVSVITRGYSVAFPETGLPTGTSWSVTLNGKTNSSSTSTIGFSEANGTYAFNIGSVTGYTASPSTGTVSVSGAAVTEPITFSPKTVPTYAVTFTESGLPPSTSWSVTLAGTTMSSAITTVVFTEPNGTYSFTVSAVTGYTASPSSASVTVNGGPAARPITFTPVPVTSTYTVTFTEMGLPSGTSWSLTLAGTTESSSSTSIVFTERNGSYAFTVGSVSGYTSTPSAGSFAVTGLPVSQSIAFKPSPSPATFLGLPGTEGYAVLGAIVAAIVLAAAVALLWSRRRKATPEPAKSPGQPGEGGPPGAP